MRPLPAIALAAAVILLAAPARPPAASAELAPVPYAPAKARARILSVYRVGRATIVRYRVDPGAARVAVRMWRSVPQPAAPARWQPVSPLRIAAASAGVHGALLRRASLPPGVYQVRVAVVSAGGVAFATARYVAPRPSRGS